MSYYGLNVPEAIFHSNCIEEISDSTDGFNVGAITLLGRLRPNLISSLLSAEVTFKWGWICRLYLSFASTFWDASLLLSIFKFVEKLRLPTIFVPNILLANVLRASSEYMSGVVESRA